MKEYNEQLSALIDSELDDQLLLDDLIADEVAQAKFSRYHLIGDVMRAETVPILLDIDISEQVNAALNIEATETAVIDLAVKRDSKAIQKSETNVVSFMKRFGQYAIAASVAGVVVLTSLVTSQPVIDQGETGLEVLTTVPFGGAANPVSLQATGIEHKKALHARNERLDALLKDHQLQLQTQP